MTNLIENLAEQAKNKVPQGILSPELWIKQYNQNFAELILEECVKICEQGTNTQATSGGAALMIKQHFGVKL